MFGLAQGFVGIAVAFLPAEPNLTLVKVLSVGAVVCIIAGLLIFFWPERAAETTQTATQSGSRNVQIQGQTVNFHGSISTGDEEVPAARLPDGRTLVDVTPAYLASLYGEHTEIQADKLLEAFVGKWMRVSGSVEEVFATDENGACVPSRGAGRAFGDDVLQGQGRHRRPVEGSQDRRPDNGYRPNRVSIRRGHRAEKL
jgi:hypothetical protein